MECDRAKHFSLVQAELSLNPKQNKNCYHGRVPKQKEKGQFETKYVSINFSKVHAYNKLFSINN